MKTLLASGILDIIPYIHIQAGPRPKGDIRIAVSRWPEISKYQVIVHERSAQAIAHVLWENWNVLSSPAIAAEAEETNMGCELADEIFNPTTDVVQI